MLGDSNPQLRQRGNAQNDRCRSRQKLKEKQINEIITAAEPLPVKLFQNKTTMSEDKHIELPKQLDLNGNITITVTGELEKSHIVAQS